MGENSYGIRFFNENGNIPISDVTVTHSGGIHSDETFAMAVFSILDGDDFVMYRTRDEELVTRCKRAIDIGRLYDPDKDRFDHHQKEFHMLHPSGVHYASSGLVWKKYSKAVVRKLHPEVTEDAASAIADQVCKRLVMLLDGLDTKSVRFEPSKDGSIQAPLLLATVFGGLEAPDENEMFTRVVLGYRRVLVLLIQTLVKGSRPANLKLHVCNFLASYSGADKVGRLPALNIVRDHGVPIGSAGKLWREVARAFLSREFIESCKSANSDTRVLAMEIDRNVIATIDAIESNLLARCTMLPGNQAVRPIEILGAHDHLRLLLQAGDIEGFNIVLRDWILGSLIKRQATTQIETLVETVWNETEDQRILIFREMWPDRNPLLALLRKMYPRVLVVVYGETGNAWRTVIPNTSLHKVPEEWVGDNPVVIIDGIRVSDVTFVHSGRFFIATKTQETAELLARELVRRFMLSQSCQRSNSLRLKGRDTSPPVIKR